MLTPEISSRLKVKDIFSHPWVLSFESKNEEKEIEKPKEDVSEQFSAINELMKGTNKAQPLKEIINRIREKSIDRKSSKEVFVKEKHSAKSEIKSGSFHEENREKIKENLNNQKINSLHMAMNSTQDLSYYEEKSDSLFDKVLTQVKERNKDKRKKGKLDGVSEIDVENIIRNENQIVLKVNRDMRDKSVDSLKKLPSKELKKDFVMLNEIQRMEVDLDKQIIEQRKKHDSFNNKKADLSKNISGRRIY